VTTCARDKNEKSTENPNVTRIFVCMGGGGGGGGKEK
jgi:hypothetical protein